MNSLIERMKGLKSIEIDSEEEFVLKIKHNGIVVSEVLINIQHLEFALGSGKSDLDLNVINPKSLTDETKIFTYCIK